jgi:hypothetical protein
MSKTNMAGILNDMGCVHTFREGKGWEQGATQWEW